jgi:putative ABC transport system ATP-binding protein
LKRKRNSERAAPSADGNGRPGLLVAERVRKVYRTGEIEVEALVDLDLTVGEGEMVAVMGPSGSGKTTLLNCLSGLDDIDGGRVLVAGQDLFAMSDARRTAHRATSMGFIFQAFNLLPTLTAAENIDLPSALAGAKPDRSWVDRVIDAVGLRDRLGHRPTELSGGQQQRVAAARALASRPSIVFADEPTGNLDSNAGAELLGFLRRSVDEFGQTIVMVTHDAAAASYADHVLFLQDGRVVDELPNPTADKVLDLMKKLGG